MTVLAVVQARTGSTRLPDKVLADLGGKPMLRFMLDRLRHLEVDRLVVATSGEPRDDRVESLARDAGVACVRGPEHDVLARFGQALRMHPADAVVRMTADCPLIDPDIANELIALLWRSGAEYASNTLVRTYPVGLDVEVLTASALETADREATDPVEREHVTPFVYRRPERFQLAELRQDLLMSHQRWTVDTVADLERVRRIVDRLPAGTDLGWQRILTIAGPSPEPASPLRVLRSSDIDDVIALAQDDPRRFGADIGDSGALRFLLERSLDDPAARAWVVWVQGRVRGTVVVLVSDCTGELSVLLGRDGAATLSVLGTPLQDVLRSDQQICRLRLEGPVPSGEMHTLLDAGYQSEGTGAAWMRHQHRDAV